MDFQYWQMQQQGFAVPKTKQVNVNSWTYANQPLSDAQMLWGAPGAISGTMIPELSMDLEMDTTAPTFFDVGMTGQSLVINPVSLSNSSDSADFENFLNSGL